jgi:hypothetical protein
MRDACAGGFLPSPALPLLPPRSSLANFAADYAAKTATASPAAAARVDWSRAARSVAEVCLLPRIEKPGEKGGDGVYVEKMLFDAFLPFNATLSVVRPLRPCRHLLPARPSHDHEPHCACRARRRSDS